MDDTDTPLLRRPQFLCDLDDDMFYIFMVWNKRLDTRTLIYDMANNVLYEDGDVTVKILGDDSLDDFLADAREKVQKTTTTYRVKRHSGGAEAHEPQGSFWDRFGDYRGDPYEL